MAVQTGEKAPEFDLEVTHDERVRVGVPDVFGGEDDHAPRDEAGVLARLEHRCEVVHGGVRVPTPHRLDERGGEVVVLVALAVVEEGTFAGGVEDVLLGDRHSFGTCRLVRELEDLERRTGVASRAPRDQREWLLRDVRVELPRAARQDHLELVLRERGQLDHGAARQQGRVHLEVRVLGRRPDQRHEPVLDRVQHGVLLPLVEAVDLVDEEDRPQPVPPEAVSSARDDRPHVVHARGHRRELLERRAGPVGHDPGDRRLPRAGRPEQDHRGWAVLLDGEPERRALTEDVALSHEALERRGAHAHGQRCVLGLPRGCGFREEVSHGGSMLLP